METIGISVITLLYNCIIDLMETPPYYLRVCTFDTFNQYLDTFKKIAYQYGIIINIEQKYRNELIDEVVNSKYFDKNAFLKINDNHIAFALKDGVTSEMLRERYRTQIPLKAMIPLSKVFKAMNKK